MLSPEDFENQTKVGWVLSSSSVWAPSFTTFNWDYYREGFHPSALYKMGDTQFGARFNPGFCPATPVCTRCSLSLNQEVCHSED